MPKIQKEKDVEELTGYLGTTDGASLRKQTNRYQEYSEDDNPFLLLHSLHSP